MKREIQVVMALGVALPGLARVQANPLACAVDEARTSDLNVAAEKWNVSVAERSCSRKLRAQLDAASGAAVSSV